MSIMTHDTLLKTTEAFGAFEMVTRFFNEHHIDWRTELVSICTDGAPAMLGNTSGVTDLLKKNRSLMSLLLIVFYIGKP